jgi:hypothetical protein
VEIGGGNRYIRKAVHFCESVDFLIGSMHRCCTVLGTENLNSGFDLCSWLIKYSYSLYIASFSEVSLDSCSNYHISNSSTLTAAVILKVSAQLFSSP